MPGSLPADITSNAMPTTPEDDDDMPALEAADGSPPDIVTPELGTPNTGPPPPPSGSQNPDFTAAQAYFLGLFNSLGVQPNGMPTAAGATTNSTTAQNASSNATIPPIAGAPGSEGPPNVAGEGNTPSDLPADGTLPPAFTALMHAFLAAGPPPGLFGGAHGPPQHILSSLFADGYGPEDESDDEEEDDVNDELHEYAPSEQDDEMPPLKEAVPSVAPPPAPHQPSVVSYLVDYLANASVNASSEPATSGPAATAPIASMHPPWSILQAFQGDTQNPQNQVTPNQDNADGAASTATPNTGTAPLGGPAAVHTHAFTVTMGPNGMIYAPVASPDASGTNEDGTNPPSPGTVNILFGGGLVPGGEPAVTPGPFGAFVAPPWVVPNGQIEAAPVAFGPFNANNLPTLQSLLSAIPQGPWGHPPAPSLPPFDAVAYVDSLEQVDIATIPAEDMRCPHCWLDFGVTEDDLPSATPAGAQDTTPESSENQENFNQMPFAPDAPNNDPVRTPCGHIFGRDCLIESLQKVGTPCPRCRQELRPRPAMPAASATPPAPTVQNGAPSAIVGLADLDEAISALVSTFVAGPEVPEEPTKPNV